MSPVSKIPLPICFHNDPINPILYAGEAILDKESDTKCDVKLWWNWDFIPHVRYEVKFRRGQNRVQTRFRSNQIDTPKGRFTLDTTIDGACISASGMILFDEDNRFWGWGQSETPSEVIFVVPNGPRESLRGPCGQQWGFIAGAWSVELQVVDTVEISPNLKITHAGRISKSDGSSFVATEAWHAAVLAHYVLTLWTGRGTPAILATGLDTNGNEVCQQWISSAIGEQSHRQSDLCLTERELQELGAGFSRLSSDDESHEGFILWLHSVANIYSETTLRRTMPQTQIILTQTLLEMLCWNALVNDGPLKREEETYKKLSAVSVIRMALCGAGASLEIPRRLTHLQEWAAGGQRADSFLKTYDGPKLFTEIRNSCAHPTQKKNERLLKLSQDAIEECIELGMIYCKILIARLICGDCTLAQRLVGDLMPNTGQQ